MKRQTRNKISRSRHLERRRRRKIQENTKLSKYPLISNIQRGFISGKKFIQEIRGTRPRSVRLAQICAVLISSVFEEFIELLRTSKEDFHEAARFVAPFITSGRNILVHYQGDMHRSPVVAALLLVRFANVSALQAIECVTAARPIAYFSGNHNTLQNSCSLMKES